MIVSFMNNPSSRTSSFVNIQRCRLCSIKASFQMLAQLKSFLSRSPPPVSPQAGPPCKHTYCAHLTYCLKAIGEETLSQSGFSEVHSINTLISDHFDPEHEFDYAWDSDYGWNEFCHRCHQERCQDCGTGVLISVMGFQDALTFENRDVWICRPCKHGRCPGWKLRIMSLCEGCGHAACSECMLEGDEKRGAVCCRCENRGRGLVNDDRNEPQDLNERSKGTSRQKFRKLNADEPE
jgi:hypothetical protein